MWDKAVVTCDGSELLNDVVSTDEILQGEMVN
jgi:hypothetical protein